MSDILCGLTVTCHVCECSEVREQSTHVFMVASFQRQTCTYHVNIAERRAFGRRNNVEYIDDVVVAEETQELDLSQYTLGVHEIVKGRRDFLYGYLRVVLTVDTSTHDTVGPMTQRLNGSILIRGTRKTM